MSNIYHVPHYHLVLNILLIICPKHPNNHQRGNQGGYHLSQINNFRITNLNLFNFTYTFELNANNIVWLLNIFLSHTSTNQLNRPTPLRLPCRPNLK